MEIRETHSFAGKTVDVGRDTLLGAVTTDIAIANVISEYKDDIGLGTLWVFSGSDS